jgi:hypothetical protein
MGAGAVGAGGAGMLPGELAAVAGTPSNLGKIADSGLWAPLSDTLSLTEYQLSPMPTRWESVKM